MWGGRWEGGSCLGAHVHPWRIHVNVYQNQYSIVRQNKVKKKKTNTKKPTFNFYGFSFSGEFKLIECLIK